MNQHALTESVRYIESWLRFKYEQEDMPGYVVAIAHKGKLLLHKAYGYADLNKKAKLTTGHIFRIASHSKTFTATALMQLQEQGKLRIDDQVVQYLPWLAKHKDKRWQEVTIRQLMSHGAGVIRDGLDADYWQLERPFPDEQQLQHEVLAADLVLDTNLKLKYSNIGYALLGLVVAAAAGKQYNTYVKNAIIKPLGLKHTGPEYTSRTDGKLVTGYTRKDFKTSRLPVMRPIDTRAMSAATGFYATAEDLCTYFSAHFVGSGKLLSDESKKEMQRIQWQAHIPGRSSDQGYGLGIAIDTVGTRKTIGHGGGFPGHITKSIADPKDELAVVVLTNFLDSPATGIAKGIYSVIDYYQQHTSTTKPKHSMRSFEGRYMNWETAIDIVATGDTAATATPSAWQPLAQPEKLEYVSKDTLKVADANSYSYEGELVHFSFKGDKVATIRYGGVTMWPEEVWRKKLAGMRSLEIQ